MIRLANETDAEAILEIKKGIILSEETTKFFISSPDELEDDSENEREKIRTSREKGNLYAVYEADGEVVGFMVFFRYDMSRLHHAGAMGMGIKEGYTNQGAGTRLIEYLLDWAEQQDGLEKICLGVVSGNQRALNLYTRMGFVEEGRQKNQVKYEDGTYADDVLMAYYI
ncbi:GNAT family N-acetyltransferase [Bacillus salacetis]|uniref:GNAT family N-acetyltransferase n=1 Tax=Bacillus salacetis TaxID=2315464 RepID=A0A3A1QTX1_9BACI|nr:GNAT family N-acetyltransferase [Bacillus salacetis]RIW31317.1 GNAT family N-acetyltransferase [Bacillus salacetis]